MPYSFKWAIEGRVVEIIISGDFTLDDIRNMRHDLARDYLVYAKPPIIHGLFNITQLEKPSFKINDFLQIPMIHEQPANPRKVVPSGWRLYFGNDIVMFRFAMTIFHESHGHPSRWFTTREAAMEFLCAEDDTLGCG